MVNKEKLKLIMQDKKARILIGIIAILLVLAVCIVCVTVSGGGHTEQAERESIATDLQNMLDYIDQVSGEITDTEQQMQTLMDTSPEALEGMEETLQEQIDTAKLQLAEAKSVIENLMMNIESSETIDYESAMNQIDQVNEVVSLLQESMQTIAKEVLYTSTETDFKYIDENYNTLKETMVSYYELLESLKVKEENNYNDNNLELQDIQTGITETVTSIEEAQTQLSLLLEEVKTQQITDQSTLMTNQESLGKAVTSVNENVTKTQEAVVSAIDALAESETLNQSELLSTLETINTDLIFLMDGNLEKINTQFTALDTSLTTIGEAIQNELENNMNSINTSFGNLDENLDSSFTNLDTNLNTSIGTLNTDITSSLGTMDTNLNTSIGTIDTNLNTSIGTLDTKLNTSIGTLDTKLNTSIGTLDDSITTSLGGVNSNVESKFAELTELVTTNHTDLKNYMVGEMGKLNESLNMLFQLVSNGKKNLASALLTKGVVIEEDATFEEIKNAILAIPQELLVGIQELPGTISYEYHYHVDGEGNQLHTDTNSCQGGCYTQPMYHVHTGNATTGGGCYTTPIYHTHTDACYTEGAHTDSCPYHIEYHTYDCGTTHDWDGDGHGCDGFAVYDCGGHRHLTCGLTNGIIGYELGCGKNASTIEGYHMGCGLNDGQITAAHIVYTQQNGNAIVQNAPVAAPQALDSGIVEVAPVQEPIDNEIEEVEPVQEPMENELEEVELEEVEPVQEVLDNEIVEVEPVQEALENEIQEVDPTQEMQEQSSADESVENQVEESMDTES